jgi:hypothetical protein
MPLAFSSLSHGEIAFGFFNIDVDMLLLEQYFLYADQFCESVVTLARAADLSTCRSSWDIRDIQPPEKVGDLMGAIHGIRYTGFIGAVYQKLPFPVRPEDFKQKPDGHNNRGIAEALIARYATKRSVPVVVNEPDQTVQIGGYHFSFSTFQELIRYVWRGGYPRWKNEEKPAYVSAMREEILSSQLQLFNTIDI